MMSKAYDRDLGMGNEITRRDFLNGVALTVAGSMLPPSSLHGLVNQWPQQSYYPPAATGMMGIHAG